LDQKEGIRDERTSQGPVAHEGSDYTVCEWICGGREVVKFFRKKANGEPYGYLSSLPQSLGEHSGRLLFAINAGMYHPDYRPVGLYIENGRELAKKAKTYQAISRTQCGVGPEDFPIRVSRIAE